MPSRWEILFWPHCDRHVFLSHCQEDREGLVLPVFEDLRRRGVLPWIDRHHYPLARNALQALREDLLRCRHVVYFLTPSALRNGRGWMATERSFAEAIQRRMTYGDEIAHVELPLRLLPSNDPPFQRSVWRALADKCPDVPADLLRTGRCKQFFARLIEPLTGTAPLASHWSDKHVKWCAETIMRFVTREEQWAIELGTRIEQDPGLERHFEDPMLHERVLALSPARITLPS